jgi:hypothetical protein
MTNRDLVAIFSISINYVNIPSQYGYSFIIGFSNTSDPMNLPIRYTPPLSVSSSNRTTGIPTNNNIKFGLYFWIYNTNTTPTNASSLPVIKVTTIENGSWGNTYSVASTLPVLSNNKILLVCRSLGTNARYSSILTYDTANVINYTNPTISYTGDDTQFYGVAYMSDNASINNIKIGNITSASQYNRLSNNQIPPIFLDLLGGGKKRRHSRKRINETKRKKKTLKKKLLV